MVGGWLMPSLIGFFGRPLSLSSIPSGYQLKATSLIAACNSAMVAQNYFSFGLLTSIENQGSIKAVITVPYRLGEGELVNYLIERQGDAVTSTLTRIMIYSYSGGDRTLFHSRTRCHGLSVTLTPSVWFYLGYWN